MSWLYRKIKYCKNKHKANDMERGRLNGMKTIEEMLYKGDIAVDGVEFSGNPVTACKIGENGVENIIYHTPYGEGDKHFVDIVLSDGTCIRRFNINAIVVNQVDESNCN